MTTNDKEKKNKNNFQPRPPVVVILGHVDHGKSSILEAIKDLKITEKESGGITQHIGAYEIEHSSTSSGQAQKITFIDTPGHEAFSAMRSRGAKVADIAVLVVAADEGVKPQTKEAILRIKQNELPFVVAANKIDKPAADLAKVKRELASNEALVEDMGGKVPFVGVSAATKEGIPHLLELILLLAEMEELSADITKPASGAVIESYLDGLKGPVATIIAQQGILRTGDIIATSSSFGKIKSLSDFQGKQIDKAMPSSPVIVLGFEQPPSAGEIFQVFSDTESARAFLCQKAKKIIETPPIIEGENDVRILNLIIKADVQGSLGAIEEIIKNIPQEKVFLRLLKIEVGDINENDIKTAKAGKARIFGFRVKVGPAVKESAGREKIRIMLFDIIYDLVQGVRDAAESVLKPEKVRKDLGKVKIAAIFLTDKNRQIVGGKVIDGEIKKGAQVEIMRNDELAGQGKIINLQKNKKDADKAVRGDDCGMAFEGDVKIEEGDILAAFKEESEKGEL